MNVGAIGRGAETVFRAALDTTMRSRNAKPMSKAEVGLVLAKESQRSMNPPTARQSIIAENVRTINQGAERVFNAIFDRRA